MEQNSAARVCRAGGRPGRARRPSRLHGAQTALFLTRGELDAATDRRSGITRCSGCVYYRRAGSAEDSCWMCHYLLDTGRLRGVRPCDCYRHAGTPYQSAAQRGRCG